MLLDSLYKNFNGVNIAHVISTFPPHVGGMGEIAYEELNRLNKKGVQVTVFTLKYKNIDYSNDTRLDFKIKRLKPWFKYGDAGFISRLFFKLKGFDLIHLHYPFYGSAQCVWWSKVFRKQKYVLTYHMDMQSSGLKKFLQKVYDFLWAFKILNGAEKIFIVDKTLIQKSKYLKKIEKEKITILPNAVDMNTFSSWPQELKKNKLKHEKVILFVGNVLPVKRLDLLFEVIKDYEDVKLLVVGGGYDVEKYKRLAKNLDVLEKVSFEGFCIDKRQLANYYNLVDVTVIPSDYESFSLVSLEALACECPVVVSSSIPLAKEIEEAFAGFSFKKGNVEDLKQKISKVLNLESEENEQLGKNGRALVQEKYQWENHINKLIEMYKDVISKK